jgi:hypothetical protein
MGDRHREQRSRRQAIKQGVAVVSGIGLAGCSSGGSSSSSQDDSRTEVEKTQSQTTSTAEKLTGEPEEVYLENLSSLEGQELSAVNYSNLVGPDSEMPSRDASWNMFMPERVYTKSSDNNNQELMDFVTDDRKMGGTVAPYDTIVNSTELEFYQIREQITCAFQDESNTFRLAVATWNPLRMDDAAIDSEKLADLTRPPNNSDGIAYGLLVQQLEESSKLVETEEQLANFDLFEMPKKFGNIVFLLKGSNIMFIVASIFENVWSSPSVIDTNLFNSYISNISKYPEKLPTESNQLISNAKSFGQKLIEGSTSDLDKFNEFTGANNKISYDM